MFELIDRSSVRPRPQDQSACPSPNSDCPSVAPKTPNLKASQTLKTTRAASSGNESARSAAALRDRRHGTPGSSITSRSLGNRGEREVIYVRRPTLPLYVESPPVQPQPSPHGAEFLLDEAVQFRSPLLPPSPQMYGPAIVAQECKTSGLMAWTYVYSSHEELNMELPDSDARRFRHSL